MNWNPTPLSILMGLVLLVVWLLPIRSLGQKRNIPLKTIILAAVLVLGCIAASWGKLPPDSRNVAGLWQLFVGELPGGVTDGTRWMLYAFTVAVSWMWVKAIYGVTTRRGCPLLLKLPVGVFAGTVGVTLAGLLCFGLYTTGTPHWIANFALLFLIGLVATPVIGICESLDLEREELYRKLSTPEERLLYVQFVKKEKGETGTLWIERWIRWDATREKRKRESEARQLAEKDEREAKVRAYIASQNGNVRL